MPSIDALWQKVSESPDDLVLRLVLADALIEAGDNRGELIRLQCGSGIGQVFGEGPRESSGAEDQLIENNWRRWFGELALVLAGGVYHQGMLLTVKVGNHATPPDAYATVRGHRELSCVRGVRPHEVSPDQYATFVDGLATEPRSIEADFAILEALARTRSRRSTRHLCVRGGLGWPPRVDHLGRMFPELEEVSLRGRGLAWAQDVADVVPLLPSIFPKLVAIRIDGASELKAFVADHSYDAIRAMPIVELL